MYITAVEAMRLYEAISELGVRLTPYYATLVDGMDPPAEMEFEYADRKEILKQCTMIVRLIDFDLACYPLTVSSVIFFDAAGNPIP